MRPCRGQQCFTRAAGTGCLPIERPCVTHPNTTLQVPLFDWRVLPGAIRRIDLGGKALTNFMKELVSYRWSSDGLTLALPACWAHLLGLTWALKGGERIHCTTTATAATVPAAPAWLQEHQHDG